MGKPTIPMDKAIILLSFKQRQFLFKKFLRQSVDAVGDKKGGKNVNGVMQVAEQNDKAEKDRRGGKKDAQTPVIPIQQRH